MGSYVEINDTLQLTEEQGFPSDVFDIDRHRARPVRLEDVKDRVFSFHSKPSARIFQIDPVRVFFVQNIGERWLFWGHALIQSQTITKKLSADGSWDGSSWQTAGTYKVVAVYDPVYQETMTRNEAPADRNYFLTPPAPEAGKDPKKKR